MRIVAVDSAPFYSLKYRCSGPRGKRILEQDLPFYKAKVDWLPHGVDSVVLTSDLQGREHDPRNRLLGVRVAEELSHMVANNDFPQPAMSSGFMAIMTSSRTLPTCLAMPPLLMAMWNPCTVSGSAVSLGSLESRQKTSVALLRTSILPWIS